jgi:hypothetical protein
VLSGVAISQGALTRRRRRAVQPEAERDLSRMPA